MAPREDFVWETDVDTASLTEPRQQLKASVFEGKLHVHIKDQRHDIDLPEDAFTDDISARLDNRKLHVRIARRDPEGPAMQEKRLLNPDRHPVELDIDMPRELAARGAPLANPTLSSKTPAEQSAVEFNPALFADPATAHKMPQVNMGSSTVTAMPVMVNQGGSMDTVSKGETVVHVPGSNETKHLSGLDSSANPEELAAKLRDTVVHDAAPPGTKVLHGQKERENEAEFDERAMTPAKGLAAGGGDGGTIGEGSGVTGIERNRAAAAGAPAGDDEHLLATGEKGEKIKADFTKNKVGMEYEERTAAAAYVDSEHGEPISSMKQAGVESCVLCACAPCQCGQMRKGGGYGNDPFEMTPAETKRSGKPAIHSKHRQVTGRNAHDAHDYRGHAKQVNESHVGIGGKLADFQGNVPDGVGDPTDPAYSKAAQGRPSPHGATHTGGSAIEFPGGPGQRHTSDAVAGGPIKGGSKTTFTTMG
ncbi:hypothetical protein OEZ85_007567 [Tetradesmus obliquus]|uniref:SHSP domain-containing protein n=1 Tax=Tetradesmus obliquus TaxID=3088 RepID=A0ABY8TGK1_TETOB|nr:hypothetical protein OEZ85_007567 [Tetradesmus obliquus]